MNSLLKMSLLGSSLFCLAHCSGDDESSSKDAAVVQGDARATGDASLNDAAVVRLDAQVVDAAVPVDAMVEPCSFQGQNLWGSVFFTTNSAMPAVEIEYVTFGGDINVQLGNSPGQASSCGRWYEVNNVAQADFVARVVSNFPDIEVCSADEGCNSANPPGLRAGTSLPK